MNNQKEDSEKKPNLLQRGWGRLRNQIKNHSVSPVMVIVGIVSLAAIVVLSIAMLPPETRTTI